MRLEWLLVAGAVLARGAAVVVAMLVTADATDFVRATNKVPLAFWDRAAVLGWAMLALVGLLAYGLWLAGDVLHDHVKRSLLPAA